MKLGWAGEKGRKEAGLFMASANNIILRASSTLLII